MVSSSLNSAENVMERVETGVAALDRMLDGGFIPESSILVRGAPGTGKTTLGLQYLLHGADQGETGLFVTFEEFPQSLYRDAESVGWALQAYEQRQLLHISFTSPQVLLHSVQTPDSILLNLLHQAHIRRVVVDSLTHFTRLTSDSHELRSLYNTTVNAFRREGLTSMFLGEETRADFTEREQGRLPFIIDCILLMRYLEVDSAIQRAITVLKMRSSDHAKTIHRYTIRQGGIVVEEPLDAPLGFLRRSMIVSPQLR